MSGYRRLCASIWAVKRCFKPSGYTDSKMKFKWKGVIFVQFIQTEFSKAKPGLYTPGIISGNMLYISGQLSRDPATGLIPEGGIGPETRQALQNLNLVLQAARLQPADVVMCRIYLPDVALWDTMNLEYARFFAEHKPARMVVPSGKLHYGCLVEVEAIAEIHSS